MFIAFYIPHIILIESKQRLYPTKLRQNGKLVLQVVWMDRASNFMQYQLISTTANRWTAHLWQWQIFLIFVIP